MKPTPMKPRIIMAHVEGSGTPAVIKLPENDVGAEPSKYTFTK